MQYKYIIIIVIIHYKGSDNKHKTGYGNGTNVNLYFSDTVYRFAVIISLKYNIYVY